MDIAAAVGVSRNTVPRYLQLVATELEALHTFHDRLGDTMVLTLAKGMNFGRYVADCLE